MKKSQYFFSIRVFSILFSFLLLSIFQDTAFAQQQRTGTGVQTQANLTLAFSANKKEVETGGSIILNWSTVNAETCTASSDWEGLKPAYGSQVIEDIQEAKTFTLTCENEAGMASMTVKIALIEEGSICKQQFGNIFWCGESGEEFVSECGDNAVSYSMGTACNASGGTICGACVYEEVFPSNKCEETDGGARDFLNKGKVKGSPSSIHSSGSGQDWCVNSNMLREYYLKYDVLGEAASCSIYYQDKECQCEDGACIEKKPKLQFSTSASKVEQGGSIELTWNSENTDKCVASDDWTGELSTSGTKIISDLQTNQKYTLECSGQYGNIKKVISVEVAENPPVLAFSADNTIIAKGQSVELTWSSENTDSCEADGGWSGNRATSGTEKIENIQEETVYSLRCTGPNGSVSADVEITVVTIAPSPKLTFSADKNVITSGEDIELTWNAENVEECEAFGDWEGAKPLSGSQAITGITTDKVFQITCRLSASSSGQLSTLGTAITRTVKVVVTPGAITLTLSSNKDDIQKGESVELSWNSTNTDGCVASGGWEGDRPSSGSETISNLTEDTTFALKCTGTGGSIEDEIIVTVFTPPPSLVFAAEAETIMVGETAVLNWSSEYADQCAATGGWTGLREPAGTEEIADLTETTTFTLECAGAGGQIAKSVKVKVVQPAPTLGFSATPEKVPNGGNTVLSWLATAAETCEASGDWSGDKEIEGSVTINDITADKNFELSCTGPGGSVMKTVRVVVSETSPGLTFSADPISVAPGGSTVLTWNASSAQSCEALGDWSGTKVTEGSETIEDITSDKVFTLKCINQTSSNQQTNGAVSAIVRTVKVFVEPQGLELNFNSDKDEVAVGESVTLQWASENAATCEASGDWSGEKANTGSETIEALLETSNFTITCSANGENISETLTVAVTQPEPQLTLTTNANSVAKGGSVTLSWTSEHTESCLATGHWSGEKDLNGSEEIENIDADKEFVLQCTGPGGEVEANVQVKLNQTFVALTAQPMEVKKGESVKLEWRTENVTECTASGGWDGTKDSAGGNQTLSGLTADTLFEIECTDGVSIAADSVMVKVVQGPIDPNPTPRLCHLILSGQDEVPTNFAHPWNVFSSTQELLEKVFCSTESVRVELGNEAENLYIWHEAYISKNGGDWVKVEAVGQDPAPDNSHWLIGKATFVEPLSQQQLSIINYVASYQCVFLQGSWKCGCRDRDSCTEKGLWSLQKFTKPEDMGIPDDPPSPNPVPDDEDDPIDPDDPGDVPDDDDDDDDDDDVITNPIVAYCGDGEVNQDWEQCDVKKNDVTPDNVCDTRCQLIEQDSCRDLTLARVVTTEVKNWNGGDVDGFIFLGDNKIPSGTWFPLIQNGDPLTDPDITEYEDVPGLAVQVQEKAVRVVLHGSHKNPDAGAGASSTEAVLYDIDSLDASSNQAKEHASGYVEIWNASINGLRSDDSGNNRLEGEDFTDGSGKGKYNAGDDEIWLGENDPQSRANFWLTVTTADDGLIVIHDSTPTCTDADDDDDDDDDDIPYPIVAYCGDGQVNQDWEQCDQGYGGATDKTCDDRCQLLEDNSCRDLTLARVVTTEVKNWNGGDVDGFIFLGDNKIPSGTWFPLIQNGDPLTDPDITEYEDVPGLAVQVQEKAVRVVLHGSHKNPNAGAGASSTEAVLYDIDSLDASSNQAKEHASGYVEIWNASINGLRSDDSGNNRLEGEDFTDGSGKGKYNAGDDEIWLGENDPQSRANFWLTVTTADDGLIVIHDSTPTCTDDYAIAYCGDGKVNQDWEQCEPVNYGGAQNDCNEQCQLSSDKSCRDIVLAKVSVDEALNWGKAADASTDIYLGDKFDKIPSGTWFPVYQNGEYIEDPDPVGLYEDVPGLAVQRTGQKIRTILHASHWKNKATTNSLSQAPMEDIEYDTGADTNAFYQQNSANKEHVHGKIEFWNTTILDLENDRNGNNKLEGESWKEPHPNGSNYNAGSDHAWIDGNSSNFWLTATTADDGYFTQFSNLISCTIEAT